MPRRPPAPPAPPPPEPGGRSAWVLEFARALRELRPQLGLKFAMTVGLSEWAVHKDAAPAEAAKHWAERKAR